MTNDLQEIKKYIFEKSLTRDLLESMECSNIKEKDNRIEARRPGGDNKRGIAVYLDEQLVCKVWTKSNLPSIDIYGLVSFVRHHKETEEEIKKDIPNAKKYIINSLKIEGFGKHDYLFKQDKTEDQNDWLKKLKKKEHVALVENDILSEEVLNQYIMLPHIKWVKEGIMTLTQKEFEVGYCIDSQRIIFPIRDENGKIVSIKGRRTSLDQSESKYLYLYKFNKSLVLYNFHKALKHIQQENEIIIFESEKSCMLAHQYGYRNCVSIGGSDLSKYQISLIKKLGFDIRIIIMLDKDKKKSEIKKQAKKITNRQVYALWDKNNLLGDSELKKSPVDLGKDVFEELLNKFTYKIKQNNMA